MSEGQLESMLDHGPWASDLLFCRPLTPGTSSIQYAESNNLLVLKKLAMRTGTL